MAGFSRTTLDAPEGGYFTRLELSNTDTYPGPAFASFDLYSLTLRVGVPEPSALRTKRSCFFF